MQHLLTIRDSDIFPGRENLDPTNFRLRFAARAVVLDDTDRVALLYAGTFAYHKLPGGGVDEGEDMAAALKREPMEEIACKATVVCEVGEIIEFRNEKNLRQTSECYLVRKVGEQGVPEFTESEIAEGFSVVWADDIDHAIALLESDTPQIYGGLFIQRRDLELLKAAKVLI